VKPQRQTILRVFSVTPRLMRPAGFATLEEQQQRKENIMSLDHDDILHLEAMELMRQASDEMLELATLEEIDLNALAHCELRARASSRQQQRGMFVSAVVREFVR
jgi:hypothetical protein